MKGPLSSPKTRGTTAATSLCLWVNTYLYICPSTEVLGTMLLWRAFVLMYLGSPLTRNCDGQYGVQAPNGLLQSMRKQKYAQPALECLISLRSVRLKGTLRSLL